VKLSSVPLADLVLTAAPTLSKPVLKKDSNRSESIPSTKAATNSPITDPQKPQGFKACSLGTWGIFSSTFLTIFLAEMGDKTQLATLLISAESHSPWIVFVGAAAALIATSLLGVLLGRWLRQRLSPKTLETSAGALLLFISVMLLWDVVQLGS
jgi:putative Ca2+/H+ antiporter (TMEM165/GDT1 family)